MAHEDLWKKSGTILNTSAITTTYASAVTTVASAASNVTDAATSAVAPDSDVAIDACDDQLATSLSVVFHNQVNTKAEMAEKWPLSRISCFRWHVTKAL